jgi:hypothetical protein
MSDRRAVEELFGPAMQQLAASSLDLLGASSVRFEPLALTERPFSHVLRVRTWCDGRPLIHFFKRFKLLGPGADQAILMRERVAGEFSTTSRIHGLMRQCPGAGTIKPVAYFPDELVIVTEEAAGQTLTEVLESAAWRPQPEVVKSLEQTMERVGAWIRSFQEVTPVEGRFSLRGMRDYLDARLMKLVRNSARFDAANRRAVLAAFDQISARVAEPALDLVSIHADLAPGNILIDGGNVTVLDFARSSVGGRCHDVSRMYTQLTFLCAKPKFTRRVISRLQQALLRGFDPALLHEEPLFQIFCLQHTITHYTRLTLNRASLPRRIYHWHVRRQHRRWLDAFTDQRA